MPDPPLRVVIAEDNYLVREGTRRLLEDSGGIDVVAAVGTAGELLDAVRRLRPSVVITDIKMPPGHHMEGIAAAQAIRAGYPGTGVVVLSRVGSDQRASCGLCLISTAGVPAPAVSWPRLPAMIGGTGAGID